ncbi:hypothetical protein GT347_18570 [Xylophilus rhododendri]|uniref:Lipoprotein n=1 Tax=Xylophilus rhododendri TaxID=2697032 RepID=A0A857JAP3_9BURK|nr:GNA1162 family protein [Xylophilus rhododendri]QHI99808.1 hypothetical protein GT347_18570 [Xylophilus rhododendri]
MSPRQILVALAALATVLLATGCAAPAKSIDYAAFRTTRPKSILVLPPVNESPDINASAGMLAQLSFPLAESGYYVLPVALVAETFRNNGLDTPAEAQAVAPAKLQEIFGADAALYVKVTKYGTSYTVINSEAVVAADARLVDLKTGAVLWSGSASASSAEGLNNGGGGLMGLLVTAVVQQIIGSLTDASFTVAGTTSLRLAAAGRPNGILYGPRSPKYLSD